MTPEEVIAYFSKDRYATQTTGIEILVAEKDHAKTRLKILPKHLNANDTVMGGCIYTIADFTFALACNVDNTDTCTLSSNIIFNAPATGEYLYAESRVIKSGKTIASFDVIVTDENGKLIATSTMMGFRKS
ncbi:MAG: PaaI family thioesterase [Clostridiales bacterium]|nr:PaaI family thioesterase [Clostridiales bacterium]